MRRQPRRGQGTVRRSSRWAGWDRVRAEFVYADGIGAFVAKMGIVALTDRRLLLLEKSVDNEYQVEFALDAIGALSLGKKLGGESLAMAHSGTVANITTLQNGQGEAIAHKFRELQARPAAAVPTAGDPIAQVERLADLRERGILAHEEFQSQKAQLLGCL